MREGRLLFSRYGLKKTGIKDLTDAVGIGQGSFYIFFTSKEELYFTILEREEKALQDNLLKSGMVLGDLTVEKLKEFLKTGFNRVKDDPFFQQLLAGENYEALLRKLHKDRIQGHIKRDESFFLPLINRWQQQGQIINEKPEIIVGLLRAIFTIILHKKEIGEDIFDDVFNLLIELVVQGLVEGREGND